MKEVIIAVYVKASVNEDERIRGKLRAPSLDYVILGLDGEDETYDLHNVCLYSCEEVRAELDPKDYNLSDYNYGDIVRIVSFDVNEGEGMIEWESDGVDDVHSLDNIDNIKTFLSIENI